MNSKQVMEKGSFPEMAERIERAARLAEETGDSGTAAKLRQLAEKAGGGELVIAFCGHFSAGKSTMINRLLGRELLPSNPIPTSANVVKIRGGESVARVHTRQQGVLHFDPETEMEELKRFAADGDTVEWVEISCPDIFLGEHAALLDTPGIDSTDAAHKVATESALHLADAVIYMMDYNHVQAEENFQFTKTLKDRGKPVFLVINMIDKHVDFELDFDDYRESVEEAFENWNIAPDAIFYTSLAEPDHPENQYEAFFGQLTELLAQRTQLVRTSVTRSALYLVEEHRRYHIRQHEEQRHALEAELAAAAEGMDSNDREDVEDALAQTEQRIAELEATPNRALDEMKTELTKLLENARLTYYSTNEAAERYLESRRPDFKVGLLFASKKTEEERAARLEGLLGDFRDKVEANLDRHFKQLMVKLPEGYGLHDEEYHAAVHKVEVEVTPEYLADRVKPGAGSREYVLNYCQDISDGIKAEYRRIGLTLIEQIAARLKERSALERSELTLRMEKLREVKGMLESQAQLAAAEEAAAERLRSILLEGE
ncbi:dynamin family protein [Brevibacillus humidisoli]|uniref:dynamin family protein n=1 Tax=Brevibacillus humidisoli TaxID=2895522 RepID=UPI0030B9FB66